MAIGGVERPLVGAVFDTAEQVVVGGVRFKHHRRPPVDRMADHQAGAVLLFEQLTRLGIGLGVVHQLLDHRFQQVHLHGLQVTADAGVFCVLFRQRRQQRLQGQGDGFFVELAQLVVGLTLPLRQAGQLFVEALFQLGDVGVEALAIHFRQLRELGFVERLAIEHRREGDVGAVPVKRHVFFQGQTLDHVQRLVVTLVERPVDGAFTLLISRVFKHRREGRYQVVDQPVDISDKRRRAAPWQFQGAGLARLIEIIHIDPVRRGLQAFAFGFQIAFDERKAAGTGLTHDKHVVTGAWHGHTELQGFDRTFLAKHTAKGLQIIGGREAELFSGERASQRFGR